MSGAGIRATNTDTGAIRETATDGAGHYQLFYLPPGEYELCARKNGFTEELHKRVSLVVGQEATVDMKLQVGEPTRQVTVVGDAPLVGFNTANTAASFARNSSKILR